MKVGVPKECAAGETRVAATPETVKKLTAKGATICVERGAGAGARIPDADFEAAGATLVDAAEALAADIVIKVRRPSRDEAAKMGSGAVLIALLDPCADDGTLKVLADGTVSALAMESIPRICRAQSMDALSSQANIAGYRAVIEGAAQYARFFPMMMTAAGAAKPAKLIVLGAGVAGLQAIATARRLGCETEAFDVRPEVKEQVESLGAKFIELELGESGAGEGGYAKELSEEAKKRQQEALTEYLKRANIIVTTALIPCRPAPVLITEDAVKGMTEGSVIVDLAAAAGGNCPLTKADEVTTAHGVRLVGYTNYPAMVSGDASSFYARNVFNLLNLMLEDADGNMTVKDFQEDEITKAALVTHGGDILYGQS
jgi:NAD(P) transhydrogenase subunit alpha